LVTPFSKPLNGEDACQREEPLRRWYPEHFAASLQAALVPPDARSDLGHGAGTDREVECGFEDLDPLGVGHPLHALTQPVDVLCVYAPQDRRVNSLKAVVDATNQMSLGRYPRVAQLLSTGLAGPGIADDREWPEASHRPAGFTRRLRAFGERVNESR